MIYPISEPNLTIQTFGDHPTAVGYPEIKSGTLEELTPWMHEENEKGMGIFFAVNEMVPGHRGRDYVVNVRAYYVDVDGARDNLEKDLVSEDMLSAQLPPTSIVYTRNGVQALWAVHSGSIDAEEYKITESGLIHKFHADKNAKDIARVLRVPGFLHMKNPATPYLCTVMYQDDILYDENAIREFYPPVRSHFQAARQTWESPIASPEEWNAIIREYERWPGRQGYRHDTLLIAAGNAVRCGINIEQAIQDLIPIVAKWRDEYHEAEQEVMNAVKFAYEQGVPYSKRALENRIKN